MQVDKTGMGNQNNLYMIRTKRTIFSIALLGLVFASLLLAQQESGSMIGTVSDPSGASVPGAEVTLKITTLLRRSPR